MNDPTIQELLAKTAIWETKARYCHLLDGRKFYDLVEVCFSKVETSVDFRPKHELVTGYEAVREFYSEYVPTIREQTAHRIANGVITLRGKEAVGSWYMYGALTIRGEPYWVQGVYNDGFVIEGGQWKIRSLSLEWEFLCHFDEGWVAPSTKESIAWSSKSPGQALQPWPE
jgi:hypothetical protein